jgi:chaperonin GroEL (HSP60 family)
MYCGCCDYRLDLRDIRVVCKAGGTIDDSELVDGCVFDQKVMLAKLEQLGAMLASGMQVEIATRQRLDEKCQILFEVLKRGCTFNSQSPS